MSFNLRQGLFSFQNLNAITLIIILAASGMVSFQHIAFVFFCFFYIFFLANFSFPTLSTNPEPPIFTTTQQRILTIYVSFAALIGLILPVAYIVHGALKDDDDDKGGAKAASPHVFLLASQVLMEGVTFYGGFSLPIRVFVPVVYNAVRMYAILDWLMSELVMKGRNRVTVGISLAMVNLVFWGFNLFGFLLPVYLPKAFKNYYADKDKDL
ncbi:hypothetical protein QVD17_31018 [Tagetes erecta]|uniref:DUF7733 domain-containing protein n=1 Tax=Tagetes erecta TaxID=13708 RepID=A0AAD8K6Q1_TARER|nr:hypothetical protein QVD17_31018 [Tagetes erecta]